MECSGRTDAVDSSAGMSSEQLCSGASGMEVVELEALDERAVEHCGRGCAGGVSGADDDGVALAFQPEDGVGGDARPRQLGPDQGATQAVEQQVFGSLDDWLRDVVEREIGDPGGQSSGRPGRIGGGLLLHRGHRASSLWIID